ncbi:hypothetical protein RUM43_007702, partial [Polyplax serrata]
MTWKEMTRQIMNKYERRKEDGVKKRNSLDGIEDEAVKPKLAVRRGGPESRGPSARGPDRTRDERNS